MSESSRNESINLPIKVSSITKRYGKREILHNVDLSISEGETVALVGINGAGKSTLLKSILNLTSIDSGRIEIFATSHLQTGSRKQLSYLAEHFVAPYYTTGNDFLFYISNLHQVRPTSARIKDECRSLDFDYEALARPAKDYSKGMMQKLGLIGCLVTERPLIILDEPMSGLDPKARALFKSRLAELKAAGVTVFFSTHLLDDVAAISDKVVILDQGKIPFSGSLGELQAKYQGGSLEQSFLNCIAQPCHDDIAKTM
ncbi:MAG: ABC-2 type transport system ATP-binding protein [Gammaproteobacteria bacterium]|jgi:ABC-2 type transport system ATP-binding protein